MKKKYDVGDLVVPDAILDLLLRCIKLQKHVLITGPRGCGKTTLAHCAAQLLNRPLEVFHLGVQSDPEAVVTGSMVLSKGETKFVRSRFIEALTVPDCIIVLDELNRAPTGVHNSLLGLMDFQARITLDLEAPDRRVVERAPGVVFVATANLGAEYVGTELLDAALLDRLKFIRLGYPDAEERILMALGLPKKKAKKMAVMANAIREQHSRGVLSASISTRALVEAGELVGAGFPLPEVFEAVVPAFSEEAIAALRTTVRAKL